MARSRIPNPLERRHLIEREISTQQALAVADAYLEEDRSAEAVVFLRKAGASERLDALLKDAVDAGDVFLMQAIARERKVELPTSTWKQAAREARAAGKDLYAETAERQAQRGDD